MNEEKTSWTQAVSAIIIKEGRVILSRNTYGTTQGKFALPSGYIRKGETAVNAVKREVVKQTGIEIRPRRIIGIRFNQWDWFVTFAADYITGHPRPDKDKNSEVTWMDIEEALAHEDVTPLTKQLIGSALCENGGLELIDISELGRSEDFSLYGSKKPE